MIHYMVKNTLRIDKACYIMTFFLRRECSLGPRGDGCCLLLNWMRKLLDHTLKNLQRYHFKDIVHYLSTDVFIKYSHMKFSVHVNLSWLGTNHMTNHTVSQISAICIICIQPLSRKTEVALQPLSETSSSDHNRTYSSKPLHSISVQMQNLWSKSCHGL